MKLKRGFQLVEVGDEYLVVPVGDEATNYHGVVAINTESALLIKRMENDVSLDDLISTLQNEYDIEYGKAKADIEEFINKLSTLEILDL